MPEPTTFDEWHKQFEHPGMSYSDEIERDDRRAAWDAAWAAATERAARVAEAAICADTCGTAAEPSEMCKVFCELYGCGTLRKVAAAIRAGRPA